MLNILWCAFPRTPLVIGTVALGLMLKNVRRLRLLRTRRVQAVWLLSHSVGERCVDLHANIAERSRAVG